MKLHNLLAEQVNIESPAFKQWFGSSKVVDSAGNPLLCYHGTTTQHTYEHFRPLTHFGSQKAAEFFAQTSTDNTRERPQRIFPVFLQIKNPISFEDEELFHVPKIYFYIISHNDKLPTKMRETAELLNQQCSENKNNGSAQDVVKLLRQYGFDGFTYINVAEDRGHSSWVIIDPSQVKYVYS